MRRAALYVYRRNLPHWRVAEATYFVTWRLAPGQPELCAPERSLIVSSLKHFDHQRYELFAAVVMNDHVHTLVAPLDPWALEHVVHGWKSFTTNQLHRCHGRAGRVWQSEYFDPVVRDEAELSEKATYVLGNPWKQWPDLEDYPWVSVRD